jgi:hypothetical protein
VGLQVGGVDHHGLLFAVVGSQTCHHLGEDAFVAPPLPTVIERLVWAIGRRGIAPSQPIAINEDNAAQHTSIINAWFTVGLGEERFKTRHLRIRQPEKIRHGHRSIFEP